MGAFFLYEKASDIDLEAAASCFRAKGFTRRIVRDFGIYKLWLYGKSLAVVDNFIERRDSALYAVGTVIYKSRSYRESLALILQDFSEDKLDFDELIGSFSIFIKIKERCYFFSDRAGIQNIFYCPRAKVLSSSFLAVIYAAKSPLHINKPAAAEILTTGSLVGPDTLIKEIQRFLIHSPHRFAGLRQVAVPEQKIPGLCRGNRDDCLRRQIELLEEYFKAIKNLTDDYGLSCGITGGFDSRLLLLLVKKNLANFQFFSNRQKIKSKSFIAAEKVCLAAGCKLVTFPVCPPLDMVEEKVRDTLERAFWFIDGQVRTFHLWTEEINTAAYRAKILGDKRISMNGVGGEQYRNVERMVLPKWNFKSWLIYELVYRYSGDCFKNRGQRDRFIEYLGSKIESRINAAGAKYINHLTVKRYLNEVYNPANRTLRTNIENQVAFSLSPYTEYRISNSAYKIIPHLGVSQKFESDMIKRLDPKIAALETDYGYDLIKGEPFHMKCFSYFKEMMPFKLYYKLYKLYKPGKNDFYRQYENKFPFVKENTELLYELGLPVHIDKIKANGFLSPLIVSLGYFLAALKSRLRL